MMYLTPINAIHNTDKERNVQQQAQMSTTWRDLDVAYLAGLIDADGYIGIIKDSRQIRGEMSLALQDKETLDWVCSTFSGKVYEQWAKEKFSVYTWSPKGEHKIQLLQQLIPFMRVKKSQAQLYLEYLTRPNRVMTENERLHFIDMSRQLNSKHANLAKRKRR